MALWYTEEQTVAIRFSCKVKKTLATCQTPYQHLAVVETEAFGPMLVLNDMVMTTRDDEFIYHEMISHPPLLTHPAPKQVAVIGGGDGGAVREVLKHPTVEKVVLVEIDAEVINYCRRYLPEIACGLADPRVVICVEDGFAFLQRSQAEFDAVLVDSPEPIGFAAKLFSAEFYTAVHAALKPDGIMVAQTESPFYNQEILAAAHNGLGRQFPLVYTYLASIPTYPSGLWSFTLASKKYDPLADRRLPPPGFISRYYTPELHASCFCLPKFVQDLLEP